MKSFFLIFSVTVGLLVSCQNPKTTPPSVNEVSEKQFPTQLQSQINSIVRQYQAKVGVCIISPDKKDTILVNNDVHYPMQSTFKFHIAAAMLAAIDKGQYKLEQKIKLTAGDLLENTWSPIREANKIGDSISIAEIISYTVSQSDNNGCDILLRLLGGTDAVQQFINGIGISDFKIVANEADMHENDTIQFSNSSTPLSATSTLIKLYENNPPILLKSSYDYLWKVMTETTTGTNRLKALLPQGTKIGHKTGSSGKNKNGIYDAINDIGIIFLPNGQPIYISVFITGSKESEATTERIMADIAKITYDHYLQSTK